jgi:type I restriction enzyme S subunit
MVNMKELFAHDVISDQHGELVPLSASEIERWSLADGDLLFGRRSLVRSGAGKVSLVKQPPASTVFESSLIRSRLDRRQADPAFYFYFFRSGPGRDLMETIVEQTAVAGIRSSDLGNLIVPTPPLAEQRRIAAVLCSLDDLIESHRETIASLRALAIAALNAASVEGDVVPFAEVALLVRDGVARGDLEPGTPYLGLEHFGLDGEGIIGVGDAGAVVSNKTRFQSGDVLYGKLRPYFRKHDRPGFDGVCTTEIWVLRPRGAWGGATLNAIVARREFTEFAMAGSGGTKMPRASWDHVGCMPVRVPPESSRLGLDEQLEALWRAQVGLADEVADLIRTRDELLPLIMSGAIRVNESLQVA